MGTELLSDTGLSALDALGSSLWSLFTSAFISATLAPGASEAVLAYMVMEAKFSSLQLLAVATTGNTLGALTTWLLGRLAALGYAPEKLSKAPDTRSMQLAERYGIRALLFSWLPVIGDGLCLAAGWLRLSFWRSLLAILMGKLLRYAAVVWLVAP